MRFDLFGCVKVSDCARHTENTVVASRGKSETVISHSHNFYSLIGGMAGLSDARSIELSVREDPESRKTLCLKTAVHKFAGGNYALTYLRRGLGAIVFGCDFVIGKRGELDLYI
jgi:hypothetical protein